MEKTNTILILGPLPPPMGGIATYVDDMLKSNIVEEYNVLHLNTARKHSIKKSLVKNFILFSTNSLKLVYLLAFKQPKIVHIHASSYSAFWEKSVFLLVSKMFFTKVVLHIHGGGFDQFYKEQLNFIKGMIKFSLEMPDKIIVLSDSWMDFFSQIVENGKLVVIPNGVFSNMYNKKGVNFTSKGPTYIQILFSGYLTKDKGIYDILKSIQIVIKKHKMVKFVFAGRADTDSELDKFNEEIVEKGLIDYVLLTGQLTKQEMIEIFKTSDVFILPSYIEGLPISLLEAMAAGLPIISTPVGGIPEVVVEGENGFLITPGDYASLANKIIELIDNVDLRKKIGQNNQKKIQEKYNWNIISKKLSAIYMSLF